MIPRPYTDSINAIVIYKTIILIPTSISIELFWLRVSGVLIYSQRELQQSKSGMVLVNEFLDMPWATMSMDRMAIAYQALKGIPFS